MLKIPKELKHLPVDKRGLPIPYTVMMDNGCPHFKINTDTLSEKCIKEKLCTVCGKKLGKDMWLIGGAKSAFHPHGAFNDAPVHKICGVFSLKVCPYLAHTSYKATGFYKAMETPVLAVNQTQTDERLPFFCFVKIKGYSVDRPTPINRFIRPFKPYREVEYWKDGRIATPEETQAYLAEASQGFK